MDLTCRIADFLDGEIRTQCAEEDQVKSQRETALADLEHLLKLKESAMDQTVQICRTADSPDGEIRTQCAEEDQVKSQKETASADQVLLLNSQRLLALNNCQSAMVPTELQVLTALKQLLLKKTLQSATAQILEDADKLDQDSFHLLTLFLYATESSRSNAEKPQPSFSMLYLLL
jgi:hypothetical protein